MKGLYELVSDPSRLKLSESEMRTYQKELGITQAQLDELDRPAKPVD